MRRLLAATILCVLVVAGMAHAHDHRAPKTTLTIGSETQRGLLYHADGWAKRTKDPRYCEVSFGTGFPKFRKAASYTVGDQIVVRFHKAAPPLEVEVQQWPGVDDKGHATGIPTPLPWVLRPYVDGGIDAWEIVVPPPIAQEHMYLGVGAYWADEDGCSQTPDLGSQYAAWTFHVVSR